MEFAVDSNQHLCIHQRGDIINTNRLEVKTVHQSRKGDEEAFLRQSITNAHAAAVAKLPACANILGFMTVQPPLRPEHPWAVVFSGIVSNA